MSRAPTKERVKSCCLKEQNKRCKKCFLCESMCFCPSCSKCPQCCTRSGCRGRLKIFWRKWSSLGVNPRVVLILKEGYTSLQNEATSHKVTNGSEWLCKPGPEPAPKGGITSSDAKVGSGKSGCPVLPSILQPVIPSTENQTSGDRLWT